MKTTHYIQFRFPGTIFAEDSCESVTSRTPPAEIPKNCIGYRFFDRAEIEEGGEVLQGKPKNYSGWTYFGQEFTGEEYKKHPGCNQVARDNIDTNGYKRLVLFKNGQLYPLQEEDKVSA